MLQWQNTIAIYCIVNIYLDEPTYFLLLEFFIIS